MRSGVPRAHALGFRRPPASQAQGASRAWDLITVVARPSGVTTKRGRSNFERPLLSSRPPASELELEGELDDARRLARLDYGLRGRRRDRRAAGLPEDVRAEARRADRRVARVVEVRVVERVEHLGAELQPQPFRDREHLDETQVEVPVTGGGEDVAARAVAA